jgi:hypothetical protein
MASMAEAERWKRIATDASAWRARAYLVRRIGFAGRDGLPARVNA